MLLNQEIKIKLKKKLLIYNWFTTKTLYNPIAVKLNQINIYQLGVRYSAMARFWTHNSKVVGSTTAAIKPR